MLKKGTSVLGICLGLFIVALAVGLFYTIFFTITPWLIEGIPQEGFGIFLSRFLYVLVAWFGGIGLPFAIFIWGILVILQSL